MEATNENGKPKEQAESLKDLLARLNVAEAKTDAADARSRAAEAETKRISSALDDAKSDGEEDDIDALLGIKPSANDAQPGTPPDMLTDPEAYVKWLQQQHAHQLTAVTDLVKKDRAAHKLEMDELKGSIRGETRRAMDIREEYDRFIADHPYLNSPEGKQFLGYHFEKLAAEVEAHPVPIATFREELGKRVVQGLDAVSEAKAAHAAGTLESPGYRYPTSPSTPPPKSLVDQSDEVLNKQLEEETSPDTLLPHEQMA